MLYFYLFVNTKHSIISSTVIGLLEQQVERMNAPLSKLVPAVESPSPSWVNLIVEANITLSVPTLPAKPQPQAKMAPIINFAQTPTMAQSLDSVITYPGSSLVFLMLNLLLVIFVSLLLSHLRNGPSHCKQLISPVLAFKLMVPEVRIACTSMSILPLSTSAPDASHCCLSCIGFTVEVGIVNNSS